MMDDGDGDVDGVQAGLSVGRMLPSNLTGPYGVPSVETYFIEYSLLLPA